MKYYCGKNVLVTGASSGIGRQMCIDLASAGARPVMVARRKNRLEETAQFIKERFGLEAIVLEKDLNEPGAAASIFRETQQQELKINILVNNAGFGFKGGFLKGDATTYKNMTHLNMTVLTELTYFFLPGMIAQKSGGVLNISSMAAVAPVPFFAVYAATKSYVSSFGCALWHEMKGTGVHIATICPGPVETEFFEVAGAKKGDAPERTVQTAAEVSALSLKALAQNKMLVPTSASLKVITKVTSLVPVKTNMRIAAAFMKEKN